ncbi:MAG: hypothetical protein EON58_17175, partial [Alphaproteobacteria bacterium]
MNRMVSFNDSGYSSGASVGINYEYDAVGNVRHMVSTYHRLGDQGQVVNTDTPDVQDYWYRYDTMNRFLVTKGALVKYGSNGEVVATGDAARNLVGASIDRYSTGVDLTYNRAGQRLTATKSNFGTTTIMGLPIVHWEEQRETYQYTTDGLLAATYITTGERKIGSQAYVRPNAITSGQGVVRARTDYDVLGRATYYAEYKPEGYDPARPDLHKYYDRTIFYNSKGQTDTEITNSWRSDGHFEAVNQYYYNAQDVGFGLWEGSKYGTYMGGVVTYIDTKNRKDGYDGDAPDTVTKHNFTWGESGLVTKKTSFDRDSGTGADGAWQETTYTHDGYGNLVSAYIGDGRPRTVTFLNDAEGRVLQRQERDNNYSVGDPRELHYYFNGVRVGDLTNNGSSNIDYAESINRRAKAPPQTPGPFLQGANNGTAYADFDQSYDAINGLSLESSPSAYTVNQGDTLNGIALA